MGENPPAQGGLAGAARAYAPSVVARTSIYQQLSHGAAQNCVILVSAPAGSGKTVLLKSWLNAAGLTMRAGWVTVDRGESSAQNFWRCVIEALKGALGAGLLRLTPAPDFDGNALISRLLSELSSLEEPLVLIIDDLHELKSSEALGQLEVWSPAAAPSQHRSLDPP